MGTLFGFVVGYIVGARAGSEGFERLQQAVREIRESREVRDFLGLLRTHTQTTLRTLSDRLEGDGSAAASVEDLLTQARARLRSEQSQEGPEPAPEA